ncbi:hypothetical protein GE061_015147 [Apolygus lucorum]|uniref:Major facilitator superfamily (MFS) profile domain-containing protein n=1 Tax=Apolygus lucorum TaxID=248454 RepID=A0A8S9XK22_APOLU|nr:hypothetical protein GE061_015147 [Apolygus lucorum]
MPPHKYSEVPTTDGESNLSSSPQAVQAGSRAAVPSYTSSHISVAPSELQPPASPIMFNKYLPVGKYGQYVAAIVATFSLFVSAQVCSWPTGALPKIIDGSAGFNLTDTQKSLVVSLPNIGAVISPIPCGYVMDRIGRKTTLTISIFFVITCWSVIASTQNVILLLISRLVMGLWNGTEYITVSIYIAEVVDPSVRGSLISVTGMMFYLGALVVIFCHYFGVDLRAEGEAVRRFSGSQCRTGPAMFFRKVSCGPYGQWVAALIATGSLVVSAQVCSWPTAAFPKFDDGSAGFILTDWEKSWIASLPNIGAVISPIPCSYIIDRIGRKTTLSISIFLAIACWFVLAFTQNITLMFAARLIMGMWNGTEFVTVSIYIAEVVDPKVRASLIAITGMMFYTGALYVSFISYASYQVMTLLCVIAPVVVFVGFLFIPESPYFYLKTR